MEKFIQIDEEGCFHFNRVRVEDEDVGKDLFLNMERDERGRILTKTQGEIVFVESFDDPLVARQIFKGPTWEVLFPYGFKSPLIFENLTLDEWDRFHGRTNQEIPFVFSRPAQAEFFNLLEDYDDDSITVNGRRQTIGPWLHSNADTHQHEFWDQIYQREEPPWELDEPAKALVSVLPQIKIPRCRILVLGCGSGNDAAYFSKNGHIVTAVDISPCAIEQAKQKYGYLKDIHWITDDMFQLSNQHNHKYDLIFEHTCYCAIDPPLRNDLVKLWKRLLIAKGHLLGIFASMDRQTGPPFGGSEWEIRQRLTSNFEFLYWTRWRHSIPRRVGKELIVYAQKKMG